MDILLPEGRRIRKKSDRPSGDLVEYKDTPSDVKL